MAVARLETEIARERWEAVLELDRAGLIRLGGGRSVRSGREPEPGLSSEGLGDLEERFRIGVLAACAVAAVHLGRTAVARRRLAEIGAFPGTLDPMTALRLGEFAEELGEVVSAFALLSRAADAADREIARRAEELAESVRVPAERIQARVQAEQAQVAAQQAERDRQNQQVAAQAAARQAAARQAAIQAAPYFA